MATITLSLSARKSKDTGKAEILLRYRNKREVALRAHTRVFILPKYFADGQIVIKNRLITPEVKEAQDAKALIERIINHLTEKGNNKAISDFTQDWAQDTIDRLLFPQNYTQPESDEILFQDKTDAFLKYKKVSVCSKVNFPHFRFEKGTT